jgi:hypothetical protein
LEPSSSAGLKERKRERIGKKQPERDLVKMGKTQKKKRRTYPEETGIRFCL